MTGATLVQGETPSIGEICRMIDHATDPDRMSLDQAKEFLENLATEIEMRIDAIKDDIVASGEK
jgi:hypothetical protein